MKKLNKREVIVLVITVTLVAGYLIFQFVILPMQNKGSDATNDIVLAQRKLAKNQQTIRQGSGVNEQYQKLVEFLGISGSEGSEFSAMISKLEMLAKEANIHVVNVQPQRATTKEGIRNFPVELNIEGQWSAISKFLYLVQVQPNLFNIQELNIEKYSDTATSLRGRIVLSRVRVMASN